MKIYPHNIDSQYKIELKVYSLEVFESKIFVYTEPSLLPYIQEYIDSVNARNPDKDKVIKKYETDYQITDAHKSVRLILELNKIESDIKPILDKIKRNKKIKDILDSSVENEDSQEN
jgi:hypothetical protein